MRAEWLEVNNWHWLPVNSEFVKLFQIFHKFHLSLTTHRGRDLVLRNAAPYQAIYSWSVWVSISHRCQRVYCANNFHPQSPSHIINPVRLLASPPHLPKVLYQGCVTRIALCPNAQMSVNFRWWGISIVISWSPHMPGHTHNCLTLPPGECSGALRSCLVLLGNAVTLLSLFSLSHPHFFPPLHSHFFASHSHFPFSCSDGFFSLRFSLFLQWGGPLFGPRGECCHPTLTFSLSQCHFFASHFHFSFSCFVCLLR